MNKWVPIWKKHYVCEDCTAFKGKKAELIHHARKEKILVECTVECPIPDKLELVILHSILTKYSLEHITSLRAPKSEIRDYIPWEIRVKSRK